jgi:tetratricopeptide (TPR) repeat protein
VSSPRRDGSFYRLVASLGIQAAEALDEAHRQGILHRDVKPANLMVDSRGHLWLTDFGLARFRKQGSLTVTGDLLGTLRYMSPEQASGRHSEVDERGDVYALGATLYELVALRPAFVADDTQQLVRQIVEEGAPALRLFDPGVPRDLETIIQRAMAREPERRYASALEFADDLWRFREDRPILARRPRFSERARRFVGRHRVLAATAAGLLLVLSLSMTAATVMLSRERDRTEALRAEAVSRTRQIYQLADEMMDEARRGLSTEPEGERLRQRFLEKALALYQQFGAESEQDSVLAREAAAAHRKAGEIHLLLGRYAEAEAALVRARRLVAHRSGEEVAQARELAIIENRLGKIYRGMLRHDEARRSLLSAVETLQRVESGVKTPSLSAELASHAVDLGSFVFLDGRPDEAKRAFQLAYDQLDPRRLGPQVEPAATEWRAFRQQTLSRLYRARGEDSKAKDAYRKALVEYGSLVQRAPEEPDHRYRLVETYLQAAWLFATSEDNSVRDPNEAIRLAKQALEIDPNNGSCAIQASQLLSTLGKHDEAAETLRSLTQRLPERADLHNNLAWILTTSPDQRLHDPAQALRFAKAAVRRDPTVGIYWNTLGVSLYRAGELDGAIEALQRSMDLRGGGDSFDWFFLAMANARRGEREAARAWYGQAIEWMDRYARTNGELSRFRREAEAALRPERGSSQNSLSTSWVG